MQCQAKFFFRDSVLSAFQSLHGDHAMDGNFVSSIHYKGEMPEKMVTLSKNLSGMSI